MKRLDSFVNWMTGLGTPGDKGSAAEIAVAQPLDDARLEDLYRSNPYAAIIVDELVDEATRKGWSVGEEVDQWAYDAGLRDRVAHAAKLGRLFGGAFIFLVVEGQDPQEPWDPERPYRLANMVVLDKREVFAHEWDSDLTSPTFGRPSMWRIQPHGTEGRLVHSSRLVYFGGVPVSRRVRVLNRGYDDSVLRRALSAIRNKTSIDQARANMVQDYKVDIIKTAGLDSIGTSDEMLAYFEERMELIARSKSNVNLVLLGEGEEYSKTTTSLAGVSDLDDRATDELTTASRMPRTRFVGESPGGLSTDGASQAKNWHSQVASYQRNHLLAPLEALYRAVIGAANGPAADPDWQVEFLPLDEPSEREQAELAKLKAEVDAIYLDRGVMDPFALEEELRQDSDDTYDPPESARNNARKALRWREEHPEDTAGAGTQVGWTRARQLASGERVSRDVVGRMAAFDRHRKNAKVDPEYADTPWKDKGYLMWLAWGGDTGIDWAMSIVEDE